MNSKALDILQKAIDCADISQEEIIFLLKSDGNLLFETADKIRKENVGDAVHLRGLIEFSNICKSACKYCGLRCENKLLERYRLSPEEIVAAAQNGAKLGYKTIVLQSGEDEFFSKDILCEIIHDIKKLNVALTLSIGERSFEDYLAFKEAGADRYLIRIETTDEKLYAKMHPRMNFENRLRCLSDLKKLGYEVGSGCLVGLPEQSLDSLANDILFFKNNDFDMIGVGPFISHAQTPLKTCPNGDFTLALKVMALIRILMPDINIPATTAMESLHPNGRILALQSGANVVMPNLTPTIYRAKYEIYPGKICLGDTPDKCRGCIGAKIEAIGRHIATDCGFRQKQNS